jgi:hypothetical protein
MKIPRRQAWLLAALLVGACGNYPRDPDKTLHQIRANGIVRVGLIAGGQDKEGKGRELIQRIAQATGAKPVVRSGETEPLLLELEEGKLDLVLGTFDEKTPWAVRVTVGPPLKRTFDGKIHQQLAPAMRNGENAWISLVEREVRDLAPEAQ